MAERRLMSYSRERVTAPDDALLFTTYGLHEEKYVKRM